VLGFVRRLWEHVCIVPKRLPEIVDRYACCLSVTIKYFLRLIPLSRVYAEWIIVDRVFQKFSPSTEPISPVHTSTPCSFKVGLNIALLELSFFKLTDSLWRRQSQQSFNTLTPFNFLFYSLHVSAPTGYPQVRYRISSYFCFWRTILIQRIRCTYAIWL
jgi:hypothetical protein